MHALPEWHASPVDRPGSRLSVPCPHDHVIRLLAEMRVGDERAWSSFLALFRPVLLEYVRRKGIPREFWDACVDEVLADESARLVSAARPLPPDPTAYLLRAARHKYLNQRRAIARRLRRYEQAADRMNSEVVVTTVCSRYIQRISDAADHGDDAFGAEGGEGDEGGEVVAAEKGVDVATAGTAAPEVVPENVRTLVLRRVTSALVAASSSDERTLLTWVADGTSYRQIAAWLHISYAATAKRVWRVRRRLRTVAIQAAEAAAAEGLIEAAAAVHILATLGAGAP
jgi:DNA-directed RNA polymerase specialized sigma24 family protein